MRKTDIFSRIGLQYLRLYNNNKGLYKRGMPRSEVKRSRQAPSHARARGASVVCWCAVALGWSGPYPRLYCLCGLLWILWKPTGVAGSLFLAGAPDAGDETNDALNAGCPTIIITQFKKARCVLDARRAELTLRILDGRLGVRRGVHVFREDGARQIPP